MSDDILETIDGALEDWTMSADAMRWSPDPPADEQPVLLMRPGQVRWLNPLPSSEAPSVDLHRGPRTGIVGYRVCWDGSQQGPTALVTFEFDITPAVAELARAAAAVQAMRPGRRRKLRRKLRHVLTPDEQHQPAALSIDGHAYRRRTLARRRRR